MGWEGCANTCALTSCGELSPVEKDCSEEKEITSMCVCDEGYMLMDGFCVKEEQCGCNTEEGATINLGSTFENCEEICTCSLDKIYTCVSRAPEDIPEECLSTEEVTANAISGLDDLKDEFEEQSKQG